MADADFNVKAIISAQTSQFEKGIKNAQSSINTMSKSIQGVQKLLKSAFSVIGIGASIKAITDFGKECVKSADSANKSLNILNNTLKVTGATAWTSSEELVKMSEDIAHSTNYTVGEIQDMQSVLLGFKNITGETFKEASDAITDMATVMGMDLKSAVQTVGKALDDPIKGLDSLKRQGFAFTDQQKEEMKVLVENGEILKAQNMILAELNTTYGGAAKAAQSSFDKQKDAAIELKEALGNQLIPIFNRFAENSAIGMNKLAEITNKIDFAGIVAHVEYVVDIVKQFLMMFYNNIKETFSKLGIQLEFSSDIFETWKQNIYNILNNVYKLIQNAFGLIKALIDADWQVAWEFAKLIVMRTANSIQVYVDSIVGDFKEKMHTILTVAQIASHLFPSSVSTALNAALKGLDSFVNKSDDKRNQLEKQIEASEKRIQELTGKTANIELENLDEIATKKKKYQKEAQDAILQLSNTTEVEIDDMRSKWEKFFDETSKNITASIKSLKEKIEKDAKDWSDVVDSLYSNFKNVSSSLFKSLGEELVGAGEGFEDFATVALNALSEVLAALGAQLAALAVTKAMAYSYGEAAAAAAAAAAAFVASGTTAAVADNLSSIEDEIEAIGDAADKSGRSLKEFIKRLEDIKNGVSGTTKNLISSVNEYRTLFEESQSEMINKLENLASERERVLAELQNLRDELEAAQLLSYVPELGTQIYAGILKSNLRKRMNELLQYLDLLQNQIQTLGNISKEAFEQSKQIIENTLNLYQDQIKENNKTIQSYRDLYQSQLRYYTLLEEYAKLSDEEKSKLQAEYDQGNVINLLTQIEEAQKFSQIVIAEQKTNIQELIMDIYNSLGTSGQTIGETLVNNIISGATKEDFLTNMKDFLRENLIKLAVYTESFQNKLAEVGAKLSAALLGSGSISGLRAELEALWTTASTQAQAAEEIISSVFGDLDEVIEETTENIDESLEEIEEHLSTFEEAMKSFRETISDLGGDLASQLIEGLNKGLNGGDFLDNMKKWIRKMLIQSVVYTESMKAEIEAIGSAISKAIEGGFTETTFHEIRRDLSWVFEQANQTIENIDNILNSVFDGYATGTNNATRGLHLVGEQGPELVKFRGGEQVLNAANTNKALSGMGKTINQNITFNNLQDTTAFNMMQQLKAYNRQMAINGIM